MHFDQGVHKNKMGDFIFLHSLQILFFSLFADSRYENEMKKHPNGKILSLFVYIEELVRFLMRALPSCLGMKTVSIFIIHIKE